MTRLAFLLAGACVVALFGFGTSADDKPEAKEKELKGVALVADRVWWGKEFELTLTAPDTGEKFQRTREGVVWDHLVFSNCFAADGKGALVAVVRFPKTKDEFTLRSVGPAEDLYALHIYQLEKTFPKLHKKIVDGVKNSPDVTVADRDLTQNLKGIDTVPHHLLPVVAAAGAKYEEKRAELSLRVRKDSHLFFPPPAKAYWSVFRDGEKLYVRASCHDRMYVADFVVEFKKKLGGEGEWEYVRISGREWFKGE